jgi:hypothetical protein
MLDATGVAVYYDGVVRSYIPTKHAKQRQSLGGISNIDGTSYLQSAINNGSTTFSKGIWIVLYSATPYAYYINMKGSTRHRGQNFFGMLESQLFTNVINGIKPITNNL